MVTVTVLTGGFRSRNQVGFLFPLFRNRSYLDEMGIRLRFVFGFDEGAAETDYLVVESGLIRSMFKDQKDQLFESLMRMRQRTRVYLFDISDGPGSGYFDLLPYVDKYLKAYVYTDRELYRRDLYGGRVWTDYYHQTCGIEDDRAYINCPVLRDDDLRKIQVGYLLGLVDYSASSVFARRHGLVDALRRAGLLGRFIRAPSMKSFTSPSTNRAIEVCCRMNTDMGRNTVSFHRKQISQILRNRLSADKLSRRQYLEEMRNAKIVVSPFGWGELNVPRDYEVAMSGSLLMKPSISHIETFPQIFDEGSVLMFKWDCSDLTDRLDSALADYNQHIETARTLQDRYRYYLCTEDGAVAFCEYFQRLIVGQEDG